VLVSRQTGRALTAPVERHDRHSVADLPGFYAVAKKSNATRHLMPKHGRRLDARIHVAVQDVQIRPADAGIGNLDLYFSWTGRLGLHLNNVDSLITDIVCC
jgi:hypothetical protein